MKFNDVFRWSYKNPLSQSSWTKSHIAIVGSDLRLRDTYWGFHDASAADWTEEAASKLLDLEFLGNLDDYDRRPEYEQHYYKPSDCLNLNHANLPAGHFFIRKGAERDRETILKRLHEKAAEAERAIIQAQASCRYWRHLKLDVQSGVIPIDRVCL